MKNDNHRQCRIFRKLARKRRQSLEAVCKWWVDSGCAAKWRAFYERSQ